MHVCVCVQYPQVPLNRLPTLMKKLLQGFFSVTKFLLNLFCHHQQKQKQLLDTLG